MDGYNVPSPYLAKNFAYLPIRQKRRNFSDLACDSDRIDEARVVERADYDTRCKRK